ncbi:MAG: hypothetical protein ACR2FX_07410, partial [Chthoniobacterales bacterium]
NSARQTDIVNDEKQFPLVSRIRYQGLCDPERVQLPSPPAHEAFGVATPERACADLPLLVR